jgi:hypothetical protein
MIEMTGTQYLLSLHEVCCFQSTERHVGPAGSKELRRWLSSKALHINGKPIAAKEQVPFPIQSVVLFPNSKRKRCTIL